jgi:kynurenine formamidase
MVDLPGLRLDAVRRTSKRSGISVDLPDASIRGRALLIRTGWDRRWGSEAYWADGPWLGRTLAERLVGAGPALVGVDFANVDDRDDLSRPAHTALLDANIPILENLRGLDQLPESGFRVFAPPLAVVGASAIPVRAFARVNVGRRSAEG